MRTNRGPMKRWALILAIGLAQATASPAVPAAARVPCDRSALQQAVHDAQRRYDASGGPSGSMTSIEMPSASQDYRKMTRAAVRAGDLYLACGNPVEAFHEYGYAAQWADRYDPADRTVINAKTMRAARLVLAYRNATALDRRGARMALCVGAAMTVAAIERCNRI